MRRQEQARQTRQEIIEAARKLFLERGFSATTIDAIANEAQVSPETIYAAFGNKLAILSRLVDVSIVGDDAPIPLLQREMIQAAREEFDPMRLIESFASTIDEIMSRMGPLFALLRANKKVDPEVAAMLDRLLKQRLNGMLFFTEQLQRTGRLRRGLSPEQAAETVWAISSGEVFNLLTDDRGWPREQYVSWLADTLSRVLLD